MGTKPKWPRGGFQSDENNKAAGDADRKRNDAFTANSTNTDARSATASAAAARKKAAAANSRTPRKRLEGACSFTVRVLFFGFEFSQFGLEFSRRKRDITAFGHVTLAVGQGPFDEREGRAREPAFGDHV